VGEAGAAEGVRGLGKDFRWMQIPREKTRFGLGLLSAYLTKTADGRSDLMF
jgi:hypothetical protein